MAALAARLLANVRCAEIAIPAIEGDLTRQNVTIPRNASPDPRYRDGRLTEITIVCLRLGATRPNDLTYATEADAQAGAVETHFVVWQRLPDTKFIGAGLVRAWLSVVAVAGIAADLSVGSTCATSGTADSATTGAAHRARAASSSAGCLFTAAAQRWDA